MSVYKLQNKIKHYEWGSPDLIPQFLGIENSKRLPFAEMWMGTHSGGPSIAVQDAEAPAKELYLEEINGEPLPFLFKLLAVEKTLSIQAHPNKTQAIDGFIREEEMGITLRSPIRNYKDTNHKPEIICALTPFTIMAGFKDTKEIYSSFKGFVDFLPPLGEVFAPLLRSLEADLLPTFFRMLYNLSKTEREYITGIILKYKTLENADAEGSFGKFSAFDFEQWKLIRSFASLYEGDPSILSPLYLNIFTLKSGQAVSIPAGVLHAYNSGFGVELMANSDNVLRGGLTPKHVDVGELMNILKFNQFTPEIITPPDDQAQYRYPAPYEDFSLSLLKSDGGEIIFKKEKPAICIITEGELETGKKLFKRSDSFFIPASEKEVALRGRFSLFAAI